jgi:hypothetical protein
MNDETTLLNTIIGRFRIQISVIGNEPVEIRLNSILLPIVLILLIWKLLS